MCGGWHETPNRTAAGINVWLNNYLDFWAYNRHYWLDIIRSEMSPAPGGGGGPPAMDYDDTYPIRIDTVFRYLQSDLFSNPRVEPVPMTGTSEWSLTWDTPDDLCFRMEILAAGDGGALTIDLFNGAGVPSDWADRIADIVRGEP